MGSERTAASDGGFRRGFLWGSFGAGMLLCGLWLAGLWMLPERLFGHYRYREAPLSELVPVDPDGKVSLRRRAAAAFAEMRAAAAEAGIILVPLSGFRDIARQKELFFDDAVRLDQTLGVRSHVCAPPGFSEHHTGYTVDLGDGAFNDARFKLRFRDSAAYSWLTKNARRFHFELSFPTGNRQLIAEEPWHWRWVGDLSSLKTFFWSRLDLTE